MSVATESICWLVAAFSFVIMWCISIALEPVRKLTRCCSDRPSRSTDHAATTSILRLVAAFSNASKFSRPLAPLTPLSAYSTTICHPRRAHPLNTRAPARARGEQAERWAEGLGIISGGVLLRSPAAAKAAALPTRTKSLSSQPSSDTANGEILHKDAETLSAVNAAFCPLPPEPVGQATPLSSLWPARRCPDTGSGRSPCRLPAAG